MKKLPIGINTLEKMIDGQYVYVDKTAYIQTLVEGAGYYFLSRPRRFGKSLLVDTLYQLFIGNEKAFLGLHIHPHWDWSVKYPVLKFDLSQAIHKNRESLDDYLLSQLKYNQQRLHIHCEKTNNVAQCFAELIHQAHEKYQQPVVILIDEYDKPLLDHITDTDIGIQIRTGLKNFYAVIKGEDANIRFVLLTGVSKFSKISLFSDLNNLDDITMEEQYSALCGYTQTELTQYFSAYLHDVDQQKLRDWYNGYNWLGESVYNPFDILLFIKKGKKYLPHWFQTGSPTFLIKLLEEKHYHLPNLENVTVNFLDLNDFDIGRIRFEILLFQTGYLTIKEEQDMWGEPLYILSYPNKEVRKSLNYYVLEHYLTQTPHALQSVYQALLSHDFAALEQRFCLLFNNIPYNNYSKNRIADYEGYYASVMYAFLCSLNIDVRTEDCSNMGRIDMSLHFTLPNGEKNVYIFEFKVLKGDKADGSAIRQIKAKDYAAKYQDGENKISLIGIEFSRVTRGIVGFEWESH